MIRYLADRLWQSLLVLAVMSFVIYGLIVQDDSAP